MGKLQMIKEFLVKGGKAIVTETELHHLNKMFEVREIECKLVSKFEPEKPSEYAVWLNKFSVNE